MRRRVVDLSHSADLTLEDVDAVIRLHLDDDDRRAVAHFLADPDARLVVRVENPYPERLT